MKRLLLVLLPILFIVGCSKPISEDTLISKNGLKYHPETKELYSGEVVQIHMDGGKEFEGLYKDGKRDGLWTFYNRISGQKEWDTTYKDGKKDGLHIGWWENGQKWFEGTYKDGKEDGLWTQWYKNGQKYFEGNFKDGKEDGLKTFWYESGQKKEEVNIKDGMILSSKEWNKDGSVKE